MGGCDTTSSFYRQGKLKFFNDSLAKLISTSNLDIDEFYKNEDIVDKQKLFVTGKKIIQHIYSPNLTNFIYLGELRYLCLVKRVDKAAVELESLPPSDDAANFHILRVYLQVQLWMGDNNINPENWGWEGSENGLIPIQTRCPIAPPELLQVVSCKCKTGCTSNRCSCKSKSLKCSIFCKYCEGDSCKNSDNPPEKISLFHDEPDDPDDETCENYVESFLDESQFEDSFLNRNNYVNENASASDSEMSDDEFNDEMYPEIEENGDEGDDHYHIRDTNVHYYPDPIMNVDNPQSDSDDSSGSDFSL